MIFRSMKKDNETLCGYIVDDRTQLKYAVQLNYFVDLYNGRFSPYHHYRYLWHYYKNYFKDFHSIICDSAKIEKGYNELKSTSKKRRLAFLRIQGV